MISFLFRLNEGVEINQAERELRQSGLHNIYIIEDDLSGEVLIGGTARQIDINNLCTCQLAKKNESISWPDQWSQFAEQFYEGKAHINLARFGIDRTLLLLPGPGFGDLSHPTTNLMLELMAGRIEQEIVLDIGCGSGILGLAALMMGAKKSILIDIDPNALQHARQNAEINQLQKQCSFETKVTEPGIVLINMILSEQKQVIEDHPSLLRLSKLWICSGILETQKAEALFWMKSLGLEIIHENQRGEWLGWVCKTVLHHPAHSTHSHAAHAHIHR